MSVPTSEQRWNPHNQIPAKWFARVDGCPKCVFNVEAPRSVERIDPGCVVAEYRCHDCSHEWRTGWANEEGRR